VVKFKQFGGAGAYKKNHSSNRAKFFYSKILHDFNELNSVEVLWAFPLLKRRRMREMPFPTPNPTNVYEEN
jgi:hypothetical protein